MRKRTIVILALVTSATTAWAAPINFTENWDSYATGQVDPNYLSTWPTMGVNRDVVVNSGEPTVLSGTNRLLVDNGSSYASDIGISHELGGVYQATDSDPIVVNFYLWCDSAANRDNIDVFVELALDDQAPTSSGTAYNALAFAMPFSVRGESDKRARYFDGLNWVDTGKAPAADSWAQFTMTVKANTVDLFITANGLSTGYTRNYTGNFDQINIRHPVTNAAGAAWLDDLSVTGGVLIPEPATLGLLALGGLWLRRRR